MQKVERFYTICCGLKVKTFLLYLFLVVYNFIYRLTTDVQEFKSSFKLVIVQGLKNATQVRRLEIIFYYFVVEVIFIFINILILINI